MQSGPQRPKRQIIKVRSQRPYIVARVALVVIVLAAIAAIVVALTSHRSHSHASAGRGCVTARRAAVRDLQEPCIPARMATIRQWSYRRS